VQPLKINFEIPVNLYTKESWYYCREIAFTGQLSTTAWQSQSPQSSVRTFAFSFSTLKTLGHNDSHVPQPMQISSFISTFGISLF